MKRIKKKELFHKKDDYPITDAIPILNPATRAKLRKATKRLSRLVAKSQAARKDSIAKISDLLK